MDALRRLFDKRKNGDTAFKREIARQDIENLFAKHGEALVEALEQAQVLLEQWADEIENPGAAYAALDIDNLLAAIEKDAGGA